MMCVATAILFSACSERSGEPNRKKTAADFNAVWSSGLSAAAPFEGAEPRDLTTHIGYVQLFPWDIEVAAGMDQIMIFLPRTDVVGGTGRLTLRKDQDSSELFQIAFDEEAVQFFPMTDVQLSNMGWQEGTKILITFAEQLAAGNYSVDMEEGCIVAPDFDVKSPEYKDIWHFQVAEYGIEDVTFSSGDPYRAKVGDTVSLQIALRGDAVQCRLEITPDDAAKADLYELFEDGDYQITLTKQGDTMYSLYFYDIHGEELSILDHVVTVTE